MTRQLTTADVPARFLNDVFLVGRVPWRVVTSDPRFSYALYIPPDKYNPDPSRALTEEGVYKLPKLPLLVNIHGSRRAVSPVHEGLVEFAEKTSCAILAPLFPVGVDGPLDLDGYKVIKSKTVRYDLLLLSILDEVATCWPGIDTTKVFMMGFSGGGQFAHRFLYLHPERLAGVSIGAPGRSTSLSDQDAWPVGISDVVALFGKPADKSLISQVPIQLIVGSNDNEVHGGKEFWDWVKKAEPMLRRDKAQASEQGSKLPPMTVGRLDGIRQLREQWAGDGIEATLTIVPGVAHASRSVVGEVLNFLQPLIQTVYTPLR